MKLEWRARREPLLAVAVAATGDAARALAVALARRPDEQLAKLRGVAAPELLIVLGESDALPWADGARYYGRDDEAPSLLLPTTERPNLPLPLVERALLRKAHRAPLLLLPERRALVAVDDARPVSRPQLERWL